MLYNPFHEFPLEQATARIVYCGRPILSPNRAHTFAPFRWATRLFHMATLHWFEQKTLPTSTMSAGNEVVLLFRYMKPCSSRVSLASFTNVLWLVTSRRVHGVTSQRTSVTLGAGDQYFMALWWAYLPDSTAAYNCLLSNCYICLMIFSPQSKN